MGYDRQIINMPFAGGLDTKNDPYQIPLGKLLVAQNCVFSAPGKLSKRTGYTALTRSILGGGGTLSSGTALFTRQNELCLVGGTASGQQTMYSYDSSNTAWVSKGNMPSVSVTQQSLGSHQYSMQCCDMAQASNGVQCAVFELYDVNATSGQKKGIGYSVVDSTTGQIIVPPTILDSTASSISPHVVVLGTNFALYYIQGDLSTTAGIFGRTLDSTAPSTAWSGATQLTSGTTTSAQVIATSAYNFDVCVSGTNGYISFNNRSNGTSIFQVTSVNPFIVATVKVAAAGTNSRASCIFPDVSGDIVVGWITAATASVAVFDSTLVTTKLAASVLDNTLAGYNAITGTSTATNTCQLFISDRTSTTAMVIRQNTLTTASYTVGTASDLVRSLNVAGKAFTYNSKAYCPAWYSPGAIYAAMSTQQTIFLLDSSGNVLARALTGNTGGNSTISASNTFGQFYQLGTTTVSGNTAILPASTVTRLSRDILWNLTLFSASTNIVSLLGYQFAQTALTFNFSDTTNGYLRAELASTVHTSGGSLQMYDGSAVVEHGFHLFPEAVTAVANGSGGSLSAGTYSYIVTYDWMDGLGQTHRSATSVAVSQVTVNNDKVTLTIPTLRITAKTGVLVQVFRTVANGTTYYQISNFNSAGSLYNSKTVDTVSWVDTQIDSAITANPPLYTAGSPGVLANNPAPPAGPICVHRNRLFVVDSTNPTQAWYSKQVTQGAPVEFSGLQVLNIDPRGGPVTALASLDDKLIVFKKDRIFMVLGQGPDATGLQNDFTDPIPVAADTGCPSPRVLTLAPQGIVFAGSKPGAYPPPYMLSRGLQLQYIGAPIEGFLNTNTIALTSAVIDPQTTELLFSASSVSMAYDMLVGQWGRHSQSSGGVDSTVWFNPATSSTAVARLTNLGFVFVATPVSSPVFTDNGGNIQTIVRTGWIKLTELQGYQRARRLSVLGTYKSPHTLTVVIQYDYQESGGQTVTFSVAADANPYQYIVSLNRQKCEAISVEVFDLDWSGTGESFSLSGLAVEVALKRGVRKLPVGQMA